MLLQVPVPPLPPTPAPEAVIVGVGGGVQQYVVIGVTMMVGFIILGIILYPLMKAFARRLEGRVPSGVDPALLDRVTELDLPHRARSGEWTAWGWPVPNRPFRRIILRAVRDDV